MSENLTFDKTAKRNALARKYYEYKCKFLEEDDPFVKGTSSGFLLGLAAAMNEIFDDDYLYKDWVETTAKDVLK